MTVISAAILATHLTPSFVTVQVLFVLSDLGEDVPVELEGEAAVLANLDLLRLQGVLQMNEEFLINLATFQVLLKIENLHMIFVEE